ncbi:MULTISPECIES: acyl-CoA carboxylase epsilon subunit [unclassified Streptomyces]|uniref:acyl-CoA carboxylase epsilon subunit n=1 Tax=unclassified Streptomyces TaxID=2593676 RepID=UPI002E3231BD|nr:MULTISPECIES: acyl-CoA carboxylase epsilon subunit [unclassified Streptomyces]
MTERAEPLMRIERGTPDGTELAALLLVLLAAGRQRQHPGADAAHGPRAAAWGPARGWRPPGTWTAR